MLAYFSVICLDKLAIWGYHSIEIAVSPSILHVERLGDMNRDTGIQDYIGIRKGLEGHSLGELEAQILDIIWNLEPPITAAKVFKVMYPLRELSYSTIMLTMSKLAKKGFLSQERSGPRKTDAYYYTPTIARVELGRKLLEEIANQIFHKPLMEAVQDIANESAAGSKN